MTTCTAAMATTTCMAKLVKTRCLGALTKTLFMAGWTMTFWTAVPMPTPFLGRKAMTPCNHPTVGTCWMAASATTDTNLTPPQVGRSPLPTHRVATTVCGFQPWAQIRQKHCLQNLAATWSSRFTPLRARCLPARRFKIWRWPRIR